jgi:hypothetical protein
MNKKSIIVIALATSMTGIMYGAVATIQELQNEEQALYDKLVEHWIDKEGSTHLGNKELDPKAIQFAFSKNIMSKQTIQQIRDSMNTPLKKFTQAQQDDFKEAVKPDLDDLAKVKTKIKEMRDQLDFAAGTLANFLGKTPQDILKMADANIRNLISNLPQDKKIALNSTTALKDFTTLRAAFDIQTGATPIRPPAGPGAAAEAEEGPGAGTTAKPSKVTAAAAVVAETKTKLSSIIKAAAQTAIYAPCGDLHFDIIEDEEGIKFLRLIK